MPSRHVKHVERDNWYRLKVCVWLETGRKNVRHTIFVGGFCLRMLGSLSRQPRNFVQDDVFFVFDFVVGAFWFCRRPLFILVGAFCLDFIGVRFWDFVGDFVGEFVGIYRTRVGVCAVASCVVVPIGMRLVDAH